MAWKAHGAVFVSGGKRTKGVVYLSDSTPKKGRVSGKSRTTAKPRKRLFRRKRSR